MSDIRCQEDILTFVSNTELSFFQNDCLACRSCLSYMFYFYLPILCEKIIDSGKTQIQHVDLKPSAWSDFSQIDLKQGVRNRKGSA